MTIRVHYAVELPKQSELATYGLPAGFPLVVVEETARVLEPVLVYQIETRLGLGKLRWKPNTAVAEAFDLRDWFDYLEHVEWSDPAQTQSVRGKPWDVASEIDFTNWRDTMQELVSRITWRPLGSKSIARKLGAVARFYKAAQEHGWYEGQFLQNKVRKGRRPRTDTMELAHTRSGVNSDDTVAPRATSDQRELVSPLTTREWQLIKSELGPLPSEANEDHRPTRDRIASETAITTGMRANEVASLTIFQIYALEKAWRMADDDDRENGMFKLRITKTKGLKVRDVLVPGYLIPELLAYIDTERRAAMEAGEAYAKGKNKSFKKTETLFVNSANAGHNAGKAIRPNSLSWSFKCACVSAGITMLVEKTDPDTGTTFRVALATHCFHDLRHTFAVWWYQSEVARGNSEPWKELQILLGHAHMQTTIDTYLSAVSVEKYRAGSTQYRAKKHWGQHAQTEEERL